MSIYPSSHRYLHSVAYYAMFLPSFSMQAHRHDHCEIMYLVNGSCTIDIGVKQLTLKPKQFVFLDSGVPHCLTVSPDSGGCTLLNYEFRCSADQTGIDFTTFAKSAIFLQFVTANAPFVYWEDRANLGYALKDLIAELETPKPDDFLLSLLCNRVLFELCRAQQKQGNATGITYLKKAKQYIDEHFCEELDVGQIADHVGLNHSYLQTLFAKEFGCGLMRYVNHQRMERATFLLKNTDLSIIDIAFHVGFNSRQHFGYTFEKRFGMSPKQYRNRFAKAPFADTKNYQQILSDGEKYPLIFPS